jgi:uridine kinase
VSLAPAFAPKALRRGLAGALAEAETERGTRAPASERVGGSGGAKPPGKEMDTTNHTNARRPAPLVIGVAGGSGSGKTTVVRRIIESIGDDQVTILEHDRYYRDRNDLRLEERAALNYDHPDSLETDLLVRHLHELRAGQPVRMPEYDFARHARQADTVTALPRKAIIVEGILIFADAALRALMDVKVFVDADADTRFIRRLQRDISERGRTVPSVIEQYLGTVKPMHLEFVEPSKRYADIIIPVGGHNTVAIDMLLTLIRGLASR